MTATPNADARLLPSRHRIRRPLILAVLAFGGWALPTRAEEPHRVVVGADVSALPVFERHGAGYANAAGEPGNALALLHEAGFQAFRLRLFVAPNHEGIVTNDLPYTLAVARRIKAAGARLMLDIHYSDTWADPAKQSKPAAWAALPFPALVRQVREYTRETLRAFVEAGVTPDDLQLGNEITNGLLWPDARVEYREAADGAAWERLAMVLHAAFAGVADVFARDERPRTILHIESTREPDRSCWWIRQALDAGLPFDAIGLSYYPEWHGDLAQLRETLHTLAYAFGKPLLVVEVAYPWRDDEHWAGKPNLDWPISREGQRQFLEDVYRVVREVPNDLGRALFYWHPESVRVNGLHAWLGGSAALFDDAGRILPAASFSRTPAAGSSRP